MYEIFHYVFLDENMLNKSPYFTLIITAAIIFVNVTPPLPVDRL